MSTGFRGNLTGEIVEDMSTQSTNGRGPVASDVSGGEYLGLMASGAVEVPIASPDPNVEEPLPSTRPDGRTARMRAASLGTAAPTVLGASDAPST